MSGELAQATNKNTIDSRVKDLNSFIILNSLLVKKGGDQAFSDIGN
jgi:hypothetical protein